MTAIKVCLDPGHYSKNYNKGAVAGYYESLQMWRLYGYLKNYLETLYGIEVVPTRTSVNDNPGLTARGKKSKGCKCYVSLHTDAESTGKVRRATAIHLVDHAGTTVDEESKELANIVAKAVAGCMGVEYKVNSRLSSNDKDGNGKKDDNYYGVLHGAYLVGTPAIIMEHSFHSNKDTASWLMKTANLKALAKAEAKAIAKYCGVVKTTTSSNNTSVSSSTTSSTAKIEVATSKDTSLKGQYKVNTNGARLALRAGAGSGKTLIKYIDNGSAVNCYGYYRTDSKGVKWLYVQLSGTGEVGYMHSSYLKKV